MAARVQSCCSQPTGRHEHAESCIFVHCCPILCISSNLKCLESLAVADTYNGGSQLEIVLTYTKHGTPASAEDLAATPGWGSAAGGAGGAGCLHQSAKRYCWSHEGKSHTGWEPTAYCQVQDTWVPWLLHPAIMINYHLHLLSHSGERSQTGLSALNPPCSRHR